MSQWNSESTSVPSAEHLVANRRKRDELRAHVEGKPNDFKVLARLAHVELELQEADQFVTFVRNLVRRNRCAWHSVCRVLHKRLGRSLDAIDILMELHRDEPGNTEVCCALAKLDPNHAKRWHEQALRADPRCMDALLAIADSHRKAERFGEASRLYEAAHRQSPFAARPLYRLGEALVQDGHGAEGRPFLMQVLTDGDGSFRLHAAVMLALSYLVDQQHESAIEYCRHAEAIPRTLSRHQQQQVKLARILKGITQLRTGDMDRAAKTLRLAADMEGAVSNALDPLEAAWDELLQSSLGLIETLRGDHAAAERHLELARQGSCYTLDVLVNLAYLRQAQGNMEASQDILQQCLESSKNCPMALLRMGYLLLCQDQLDRAAQYLQKCLMQPMGTLMYGAAEKGAAHLYLCVAHHRRATAGSGARRSAPEIDLERLAEEHFRTAFELQPDLRRALTELATRIGSNSTLATIAARLVSGDPPRMGLVDLTPAQAAFVLVYAERRGLVPSSAFRRQLSLEASRKSAAPAEDRQSSPSTASLSNGAATGRRSVASSNSMSSNNASVGARSHDESSSKPIHLSGSLGPSPTLVSTSSTLAPACSASSVASQPPGSAPGDALKLCAKLTPDKIVQFSDVELGECISHGEYAIVHRGSLHGADVVVKTLHQKDCMYDEQAAMELRSEIEMISELVHQRLVVFVAACLEPSHIALITELAPGGNLHQALHVRRRLLARRERFQLAVELLEGVGYLHTRTPVVVHLDLKSMNLVLDADGQHLRICDFGLAHKLDKNSNPGSDRPLSRGGSPRYMAPECHDSSWPITEKADVWSSGCILIEIFGESLPYAECSNVQQILKLMLVHHSGPSVPATIEPAVRSVIASMLDFEAPDRLAITQAHVQMQAAAGDSDGRSRFAWMT